MSEIATFYLRGSFVFDVANIAVIVMTLAEQNEDMKIQYFFVYFRFPALLKNIELLEHLYITTFISEQYWKLFFVFVTNFTVAHFLSLALNSMPKLNHDRNWLVVSNRAHERWQTKYLWGYYWATTIMLTVGFGDLAATNL